MESDALAGVQHALRAVDVDLPDATVSAAIDELMASVRADAHSAPGIREAVTALAEAGMRLAVISNAVYHPFLEWCLADWGLARRIHVRLFPRRRAATTNPTQGIYHCALEALGTSPAETVHIGDSYRFDVEAAHALGMRTVWLNLTGDRPRPMCRRSRRHRPRRSRAACAQPRVIAIFGTQAGKPALPLSDRQLDVTSVRAYHSRGICAIGQFGYGRDTG